MRKAILTGATGVVGAPLIEKLISCGVYVTVICRPNSERINAVPKHRLVDVVECDISNLMSLAERLPNDYDVFYHFAWDGTYGLSRQDMKRQANNIIYTLDAVHLAKKLGCRTFIGAGSQAEYGRCDEKLKPDTPCFPENGYGIAKLCAGQMSRERARQLGIKHIWVRILSVYGPNDGENTLIMSVIRELKRGNIPRCTKGEQIWDYLYSSDAANAFYLLGSRGIGGKTYVLGAGHSRPLSEYISEIRDVVAPDGKVALGALPYSPEQVMHLEADVSDLKKDLAWQASTKFSDGILNILHTWNHQ